MTLFNADTQGPDAEQRPDYCVFFLKKTEKSQSILPSLLASTPGDSSGPYCSSSTFGILTNMLPTVTVLPFLKHLILGFCIYSFLNLSIAPEAKKGPGIQQGKRQEVSKDFILKKEVSLARNLNL